MSHETKWRTSGNMRTLSQQLQKVIDAAAKTV